MPLTTITDILRTAAAERWAVGAFNVENMEMVQAVVAAADELDTPVILQTTPSTLRYATPQLYRAITATVAEQARVPVALHLDHGDSFELALQALRHGYTSVMIDGSLRPYEENVSVTAAVVRACAADDVPVEGGLGRVGGTGNALGADRASCTEPAQAADFVRRTGITSLAVAIGTARGVHKDTPLLDVDLLSRIHAAVDVPLVLHGGSGLPEDAVRDCIKRGIAKVNFGTELRAAYSTAVRDYLAEAPGTIDPKLYTAVARRAVHDLAADRIRMCTLA